MQLSVLGRRLSAVSLLVTRARSTILTRACRCRRQPGLEDVVFSADAGVRPTAQSLRCLTRFSPGDVHTGTRYMGSLTEPSRAEVQPYHLTPLSLFGAEVRGIDLKQPVSSAVQKKIKDDITQHRLLVFRDQGVISGERQVVVSSWFGEMESTFYKHPRSPHPDIFRVSNVKAEGCTGVGRTGWHIDGSFMEAPFAYSIYHIVRAPKRGATLFAPLTEIVAGLSDDERDRWERLWMVTGRSDVSLHPLIYSHPMTGHKTMCFHTGMTEAFVYDYNTPEQRITDHGETAKILQEIDRKFRQDLQHLVYAHEWRPGDFIITDNLAVGHEASPETQLPAAEVGLRVMHRSTVMGTAVPSKEFVAAV